MNTFNQKYEHYLNLCKTTPPLPSKYDYDLLIKYLHHSKDRELALLESWKELLTEHIVLLRKINN